MKEARRIGVHEAQQLMARGHRYVDVRSEPEYESGHPAGALNVPFLCAAAGGLAPNEHFLAVMEALFARDDELIIGCQAGRRSQRAARALVERGYSEVVELRPGYGGRRDAFGQVVEPGWAVSGLPTERHTPGGSWEELEREAGR